MDIDAKLKEAKSKQVEVVGRANLIAQEISNLSQQRQMLLQETLKYEGEIRPLTGLKEEKK
ncbi:unnamed protein product [marine sediment metagenome]|uniref:Uncharacterized protein n=1 Tax=marine sediment metagenome TaxID=412755 RepID=X1PS82_9ZZZZ